MGALISILVPLLPGIISGVEKLVGRGKGDKKKEVAVEMANAALKKLREQGVFQGNEGALQVVDLVEAVFASMKSTGLLQEEKPGDRPAEQRVAFEGVLRTL